MKIDPQEKDNKNIKFWQPFGQIFEWDEAENCHRTRADWSPLLSLTVQAHQGQLMLLYPKPSDTYTGEHGYLRTAIFLARCPILGIVSVVLNWEGWTTPAELIEKDDDNRRTNHLSQSPEGLVSPRLVSFQWLLGAMWVERIMTCRVTCRGYLAPALACRACCR